MLSQQQVGLNEPAPLLERALHWMRESGVLGFLNVMVGNGLYVVLGFVCNLVIANGLGPEAYGLLAIAVAVMTILQETCGGGIDLAMVRLAAQYTETNPRRAQLIFKLSFRLKMALTAVVAGLLLAIAGPLATGLFDDPALEGPLRWAALGVFGGSLSGWTLARFQTEERFGSYAVFRTLNNSFKLIGLGALWYFSSFDLSSVLALSMAVFFGAYVVGLFFVPRTKVKAETREESRLWVDVLSFGRWIMASHLLFTLYSRIDLLMVGKLLDSTAAAYYSVAWNFTFPMDLVTYTVILALLPRVARLTQREEYLREAGRIFRLCCCLAAAMAPLYFLADPLISNLFPEYSSSIEIFQVLFLGPIVTVLVHPLYLILYARDKVALLVAVDVLLVIACAGLCYWLIPQYGMLGAAWATVGARLLNCLLILYLVMSELRGISAGK